MCRFVAYMGRPLLINDVISKPKDSLIRQSLQAMETDVKLNGDGFGIGWYVPEITSVPAVFVSALPAWNDMNLKNLSHQIKSSCFFAHVRAAEEGTVTQVNCHPFHYDKYLMMHNGGIGGYKKIKLAILNRLHPDYFAHIKGQTDSEVLFMLWLTCYHELPASANRMLEAWELVFNILAELQDQMGIKDTTYINSVISDGDQMVAVRYVRNASECLTMHYAAGSEFIYLNHGQCRMMPKIEGSHDINQQAVLVASEKLTGNTEEWLDVPAQHFLVVDHYRRVSLVGIKNIK